MTETLDSMAVDLDELRASIRAEYAAVAAEPDRGFHFHTGYRLAAILGYSAHRAFHRRFNDHGGDRGTRVGELG